MAIQSGVDAEPQPADSQVRNYEVFNPDYSVGVACDCDGFVVGLHLDDEVWENTDRWLAAEIVRVAKLAYLKARVGRRVEMERRHGNTRFADALNPPTEEQYRRAEKVEFGVGGDR